MSGRQQSWPLGPVDSGRGGDPVMLGDERRDLRSDCRRCAGLCCVAPTFAASADFAIDKPAGWPCPNLRDDFRCSIHASLREQGFGGCAVFDCFGAGQQVVQVTFGGADWRQTPEIATSMFTAFTAMRQLHELLWHLAEAAALLPTGALHDDVERAQARTRRLTAGGPDDLVALDAGAYRREVGPLLDRVSEVVRAGVRNRQADRKGSDLIGAKLRGADPGPRCGRLGPGVQAGPGALQGWSCRVGVLADRGCSAPAPHRLLPRGEKSCRPGSSPTPRWP